MSCCQRERTCSRWKGLVVVVRLRALRSPLTEDESERSRKSALRGEISGGKLGFLVGRQLRVAITYKSGRTLIKDDTKIIIEMNIIINKGQNILVIFHNYISR